MSVVGTEKLGQSEHPTEAYTTASGAWDISIDPGEVKDIKDKLQQKNRSRWIAPTMTMSHAIVESADVCESTFSRTLK